MGSKRRRSEHEDDEDDDEAEVQLPAGKRWCDKNWLVPSMEPRYRPASLFIEYGPTINYNSQMLHYCRLCRESVTNPRSQLAVTDCNHGFHYECIMDSADESDRGHECPTCKRTLQFIVHGFFSTTKYTRTTFNWKWRY